MLGLDMAEPSLITGQPPRIWQLPKFPQGVDLSWDNRLGRTAQAAVPRLTPAAVLGMKHQNTLHDFPQNRAAPDSHPSSACCNQAAGRRPIPGADAQCKPHGASDLLLQQRHSQGTADTAAWYDTWYGCAARRGAGPSEGRRHCHCEWRYACTDGSGLSRWLAAGQPSWLFVTT